MILLKNKKTKGGYLSVQVPTEMLLSLGSTFPILQLDVLSPFFEPSKHFEYLVAFISIDITSVLYMFYSLCRFKHLKDILIENTTGFQVGGSGCGPSSGHLPQQDKLAPA